MKGKYSNFLTVLIIIVIIAVIGLLVFVGVNYYKNYYLNKEAREAVDAFTGDLANIEKANTVTGSDIEGEIIDPYANITDVNMMSGSTTNTKTLPQYKGFDVVGTIEIPQIDLKYPILSKVTTKSLNTSVAKIYGGSLNNTGNVVIAGHNYRNGTFFSNLYKLSEGDRIYITDWEGKRVEYTIYKKYEADPDDSTYYYRDVEGRKEISLTTCTDDSSKRTIVWAKEAI